jgi:ATP-dependent DNA helicase DinG
VTEAIERIFAPGGPIARTLPAFEPRAGQVQMAQVVERALLEGMHSIVEAGTGVGKSLGYLVPAIRSGKKVVLSTGTIALQEQLVTKDIPLVGRALGVPLRVTLLKGRSHYLCRQKFERLRAERLVASSASMQRIWEWGDRTATGDRAELPFLPPSMAPASSASTSATVISFASVTRQGTPISSSSTTRCFSWIWLAAAAYYQPTTSQCLMRRINANVGRSTR